MILYLYDKKIGSVTYNADQVCGKSLYMAPNKSINLRTLPNIITGIIKATPKGGEYVGVVYSYVVRTDGIWWMVDRGTQRLFCKHYEGAFDVKTLANQGALTAAEIAARKLEAEKTFGEKEIDKLMSIVKPLAFLVGGAYLLSVILKN